MIWNLNTSCKTIGILYFSFEFPFFCQNSLFSRVRFIVKTLTFCHRQHNTYELFPTKSLVTEKNFLPERIRGQHCQARWSPTVGRPLLGQTPIFPGNLNFTLACSALRGFHNPICFIFVQWNSESTSKYYYASTYNWNFKLNILMNCLVYSKHAVNFWRSRDLIVRSI